MSKIIFSLVVWLVIGTFLYPIRGAETQSEPGSDWVLIDFSKDTAFFYNPKKVNRTSDGIVMAWIRKEAQKSPTNPLMQEPKRSIIKDRKAQKRSITGYNKWAHSLTLYEFDCPEKKSRIVSQTDYDKAGNPLDSWQDPYYTWRYAVPGSVGESMLLTFCPPEK